MSEEKKYKKSIIAIACYVFAALLLIYVCYIAGNTISTVNQYYAQYGISATAGEYVTYIIESGLTPLVEAVLVFMAGCILDAVRMSNPDNYFTEEELAEIKIAKREAKEAQKAKKKAASESGAADQSETDVESVKADFEASLDAELKEEEAAHTTHPKKKKSGRNQFSGDKSKNNFKENHGSGDMNSSRENGYKNIDKNNSKENSSRDGDDKAGDVISAGDGDKDVSENKNKKNGEKAGKEQIDIKVSISEDEDNKEDVKKDEKRTGAKDRGNKKRRNRKQKGGSDRNEDKNSSGDESGESEKSKSSESNEDK